MLQIEFTEEDIKQLDYFRYNYPQPIVQKRCEVLWLKSQGFKRKEIAKICRVSTTTCTIYLHLYKEGGLEALRKLNYPKRRSELYKYQESIEKYLTDNPPATIQEAGVKIEELTTIKRSKNQIWKFLRNCGFKFRKIGIVPAKADVEAQKKFIKEKLEPRLEEAQKKERAVFFVDAAHFVMGAFIGYLWSCVRLFVKTSPGRQRFNVLGAIDSISKKLITVTNDAYINSESVCDLLREIASLNLQIPITLILDNARYQRCKLVQGLAVKLKIELLFLPPYSPNLNLIERLWKFVKKKCLYSHYYEDFDAFKNGITDCLGKTGTEYKKELDSLLTPKFQSFENVKF